MDVAKSKPDRKRNFCALCGERAITECPTCATPFEGAVHNVDIAYGTGTLPGKRTPPSYCHECGTVLPWTAKGLKAAGELTDLEDSLSKEDKELFKENLPELIRDTSQTPVAIQRIKALVAKTRKDFSPAFQTIVVNIICEAAKRQLFS